MLPYEFHPLAEAELDEAVAHHEAIQPGKGLEFASQVQAAIEQIRSFPHHTRPSPFLAHSAVHALELYVALQHQKHRNSYSGGRASEKAADILSRLPSTKPVGPASVRPTSPRLKRLWTVS